MPADDRIQVGRVQPIEGAQQSPPETSSTSVNAASPAMSSVVQPPFGDAAKRAATALAQHLAGMHAAPDQRGNGARQKTGNRQGADGDAIVQVRGDCDVVRDATGDSTRKTSSSHGPRSAPAAPPTRDQQRASTNNCMATCRESAPRAARSASSRRRSSTRASSRHPTLMAAITSSSAEASKQQSPAAAQALAPALAKRLHARAVTSVDVGEPLRETAAHRCHFRIRLRHRRPRREPCDGPCRPAHPVGLERARLVVLDRDEELDDVVLDAAVEALLGHADDGVDRASRA